MLLAALRLLALLLSWHSHSLQPLHRLQLWQHWHRSSITSCLHPLLLLLLL
jgi:hypothetical protein